LSTTCRAALNNGQGKAIELRVNGKRVDAELHEGFLKFTLSHQRHIPATWKISLINN